MVFTETHFCLFGVAQDRNPFEGDQPTEAEAAEAYRTMFGGGGTYTVSGSTLILNEEYDRIPGPQHPIRFEEFNMAGDKLTFISPYGNAYILRRVS
jgi:hypothetical protein